MNEMDSGKAEFARNMQLSYEAKNRGLEIKLATMEILYQQLQLLVEESQECSPEELHCKRQIMALLGQAIIPD